MHQRVKQLFIAIILLTTMNARSFLKKHQPTLTKVDTQDPLKHCNEPAEPLEDEPVDDEPVDEEGEENEPVEEEQVEDGPVNPEEDPKVVKDEAEEPKAVPVNVEGGVEAVPVKDEGGEQTVAVNVEGGNVEGGDGEDAPRPCVISETEDTDEFWMNLDWEWARKKAQVMQIEDVSKTLPWGTWVGTMRTGDSCQKAQIVNTFDFPEFLIVASPTDDVKPQGYRYASYSAKDGPMPKSFSYNNGWQQWKLTADNLPGGTWMEGVLNVFERNGFLFAQTQGPNSQTRWGKVEVQSGVNYKLDSEGQFQILDGE